MTTHDRLRTGDWHGPGQESMDLHGLESKMYDNFKVNEEVKKLQNNVESGQKLMVNISKL